jgi:hypothetical protein
MITRLYALGPQAVGHLIGGGIDLGETQGGVGKGKGGFGRVTAGAVLQYDGQIQHDFSLVKSSSDKT